MLQKGTYFKETVCGGGGGEMGYCGSRLGQVMGSYQHSNELSGYLKGEECID
jgi:hypothetical protein